MLAVLVVCAVEAVTDVIEAVLALAEMVLVETVLTAEVLAEVVRAVAVLAEATLDKEVLGVDNVEVLAEENDDEVADELAALATTVVVGAAVVKVDTNAEVDMVDVVELSNFVDELNAIWSEAELEDVGIDAVVPTILVLVLTVEEADVNVVLKLAVFEEVPATEVAVLGLIVALLEVFDVIVLAATVVKGVTVLVVRMVTTDGDKVVCTA